MGQPESRPESRQAWYRELNRYQWFVLIVASVGWMFDTMAQQLFNLARVPAIRELLGGHATPSTVSEQAGYVTMVFMIGWALGGVLFGVLGDRLGRAKTMMLTILCYTIFTGVSVLSTSVWDFGVYRFRCFRAGRLRHHGLHDRLGAGRRPVRHTG